MTTTLAPWSAPTIEIAPIRPGMWLDEDSYSYSSISGGVRREADGWVARVELDTHTGRLSIHANNGRGPHDMKHRRYDYYVPERDMWGGSHHTYHTPKILAAWCVREITREQADHLLTALTPVAQRIVQALEPVTGGGWDWTVDAINAYRGFFNAVEYPNEKTTTEKITEKIEERAGFSGTVTFDQVMKALPAAVDPAWTLMSDAELDRVAAAWCGGNGYYAGGDRSPCTILESYDKITRDAPYTSAPTVVNARCGLRRLRAKLVEEQTGYPAEPAAEWFRIYPGDVPTITPDLDDTQLSELGDLTVARIAHAAGKTLVGIADYLRNERAQLRDLVRAEAEIMGERTNELLAAARQAQTARAAMAARIAGWGDPKESDDAGEVNAAEIGRLVGMSRQGVAKLLAKLTADEEDAPES